MSNTDKGVWTYPKGAPDADADNDSLTMDKGGQIQGGSVTLTTAQCIEGVFANPTIEKVNSIPKSMAPAKGDRSKAQGPSNKSAKQGSTEFLVPRSHGTNPRRL